MRCASGSALKKQESQSSCDQAGGASVGSSKYGRHPFGEALEDSLEKCAQPCGSALLLSLSGKDLLCPACCENLDKPSTECHAASLHDHQADMCQSSGISSSRETYI